MIEIPGYTLLHKLGRGGMGEVYLAVQQSLGRQVALKLLTPEMEHDERARERFVREARIAANLHHQHIVPIHDVGVHDGIAYIAMEFEPGGTVAELVHEPLEPGKALRIARDVASALDYAHRQGVVHRDVKPENVLRRPDGHCLLSDFGISRAREQPTIVTQEGNSVGTPQYMSPEQLRGQELDGRADLYSLGVMLYQLLTGTLPFDGADLWAIGTQHVSAPIPYLPEHLAHIQPLVDALMAKEPDARPKSGADVVARIEAILAGSKAHAAPSFTSESTRPMQMAVPARARRTPLLIGAAAVLLALAGFGIWQRSHVSPPATDVDQAPAGATKGTSGAAPAGDQAPSRKSIAVLPFTDLSPGHDQEYFSDGMAEELLNALAKVKDLKVAGRTSSFSFKGRHEDLRAIGQALAVAHVLEGSVRKQGDKVRITAQLVQASDGFHLWSESYDGELTDVFELQERIARAIVQQLQVVLQGTQQERLVPEATGNPEAYALYLKASVIFNKRDGPHFPDAIADLNEAIRLDPAFARAYARLAALYATSTNYTGFDPRQASAAAERAARRAFELDPTLAEPHAALGMVFNARRQRVAAREELERALALDPRDVTANVWSGIHLITSGYRSEGRARLDQALATDPLHPVTLTWRGFEFLFVGDTAKARPLVQQAADSGLASGGHALAVLAHLEGNDAEAVAQFTRGTGVFMVGLPEGASRVVAEGVYGDETARRKAVAMIEAYLATGPKVVSGAAPFALLYLREPARALEVGQAAPTTNDSLFFSTIWAPLGDEARKLPQFAEFARRAGLADLWDKYGPPDRCTRKGPGDYSCG